MPIVQREANLDSACDIPSVASPGIFQSTRTNHPVVASRMPYGQRRELYEAVIEEIRLFNRHLHVVPVMPEGGDPVEFYRAMPHDPRGLLWSEGVVVKYRGSADQWFNVKANDTLDVRVTRCIEGTGKFAGSLGAMVVEEPTGAQSEFGSFQLTNEKRR